MGKSSRADPRSYGTTTSKIRGSWWFVLKCANGDELLVHCSPVTSIADIIKKGHGNVDTHVAKMGSKVLVNNKCLEDYKINTNGSTILMDYDWDGKLSVVTVTAKNVLTGILDKFKGGKSKEESGEKTIEFWLGKAVHLPGVDSSGTSDPYVVMTLSMPNDKEKKPITAKSKTVKKSLNPQWGEVLALNGSWLNDSNYLEASLKISVYDANVLGKDVFLGESTEIPLKQIHNQIQYYTTSLRNLWVPLQSTKTAPVNGWVQLAWIFGSGKPGEKTYNGSIFWTDYVCGPVGRISDNGNDSLAESPEYYLTFKSNLTTAISFLNAGLFKDEPTYDDKTDKLQISVTFGENDDWKQCSPHWTPKLLSGINRLVLEVGKGHTAEEVKQLLEVVKQSSVSHVHLLDFDQSMALEDGMVGLKGAVNVTTLKYSDDEGQPSEEGVNALIGLIGGLPKLETVILSLSESMWKERTMAVKLLQFVCNSSSVKSLQLVDVNADTDIDFTQFLAKSTLESVSIEFKVKYGKLQNSPALESLITSLKGCPVSQLKIFNLKPETADFARFVQSLQEMPNLTSFWGEMGDQMSVQIVPLLESSQKLKELRFDNGYDAKNLNVNKFLELIPGNTTLETLSVTNFQGTSSTLDIVVKIAEQNNTLKKLMLKSSYDSRLYYVDTSYDKALQKNTTLMKCVISLTDYNAFSSQRARDITKAWESRGATYSTN